ncbi:hypothetical protein OUZ56_032284 [Daphnia magna]|uniref:Uncharacterized protein n=1 Tax=Daphnia magna TaxID=35525 RepID=A0ABQ9ZWQ4_9CRUS|nr:hypothetical protein OUZ56_032284 [Daphnia magna]
MARRKEKRYTDDSANLTFAELVFAELVDFVFFPNRTYQFGKKPIRQNCLKCRCKASGASCVGFGLTPVEATPNNINLRKRFLHPPPNCSFKVCNKLLHSTFTTQQFQNLFENLAVPSAYHRTAVFKSASCSSVMKIK